MRRKEGLFYCPCLHCKGKIKEDRIHNLKKEDFQVWENFDRMCEIWIKLLLSNKVREKVSKV